MPKFASNSYKMVNSLSMTGNFHFSIGFPWLKLHSSEGIQLSKHFQ